jgi:clan AA aspartic protease (TIGR02281 family)
MSGTTTKVAVAGSAVMVPVNIEYKGTEIDVLLLLDTGSSRTVVSADIARRLNIDLSDAEKTRAQVVGGALIEARRVRLSAITVGPHTIKNVDVLVVEHTGPPVKHHGLLGMDLLRKLKYNIDFQKQTITWE